MIFISDIGFETDAFFYILKGDACNYLYFLCNGSMEILKGGMVVAILGSYLLEYDLLSFCKIQLRVIFTV